jgi:molybdate transport system substrate-binding protein
MMLRRPAVAASLALSLVLALGPAAVRSEPLVAAAANVRYALEELSHDFRVETGIDVRTVFGSSGNLARQIEQGAPFELFVAADEDFVLGLAGRGFTRDDGVVYAVGRLVLFAPRRSPLVPDSELKDLRSRLADGTIRRFAIANPEHAPYGAAAEQALRSAGLWAAIEPTLVLGENIAQAAQFAASGNADGGIIAYSLALAPQFRDQGKFALLPETLHAPLRQRMALTRLATPEAERFYEYLQSRSARATLERFGFALPQP